MKYILLPLVAILGILTNIIYHVFWYVYFSIWYFKLISFRKYLIWYGDLTSIHDIELDVLKNESLLDTLKRWYKWNYFYQETYIYY